METQYTIGLSQEIMSLIRHGIYILQSSKVIMAIALAILTYNLLNVFLEKQINLAQGPVMERKQVNKLLICVILLVGTIAPPLLNMIMMLGGSGSAAGIFLSFIGSGIFCLVMSFILKRQLDKDDPRRKRWVLLVEAIEIGASILAQHAARLIQSMLVGLINIAINVIRAPFICYYLLVATLLNLAISIILVKMIGSSQIAGEVNVIGSILGGTAHAILKRRKIAELKAEMNKEQPA